jgi:hypothetical protein
MESIFDTLSDFITRNWYFLIIIATLLWMLRRGGRRETVYQAKDEFDALITSGKPVIAEFYNDT